MRVRYFILCCTFVPAVVLRGGSLQDRAGAGIQDGTRVTAFGRFESSGTARALYNTAFRIEAVSHTETARQFIRRSSSLLGVRDPDASLRVLAEVSAPGGSHVRFQQHVSEFPVYGAEIVISTNALGSVTMVMNGYRDIPAPPTLRPQLDEQKAVSIARSHLGAAGRSLGKDDSASPFIFPFADGTSRLVYRVSVTTEIPYGDWEVIVDAASGSVLKVEDQFVCHHGGSHARGKGYVYVPDPVSAARTAYGDTGLLDAADAGSDRLDALRTLVPLDSLSLVQGLYHLSAPGCAIVDIEPPDDPFPYAHTSPDSFLYSRSQPGFEAVMAFYHARTAYRRVGDLGFATPGLARLRIDPHGFYGEDNSHYSPSGNWVSLGTGGVDDGEDASVIWHEYGHAIHWNLAPGWGGGEMAALGEGYADYWAGSYLRSLGLWGSRDEQYHWIFLWDGHNEFWTGRRLDAPGVYPFGTRSAHSAGEIWATALIGIQGDLGRDVTDKLVLKSLMYLGYGATAVDAAQAMLQADRDLFNGAHLPTLVYWLGSVKNFLPPSGGPTLLVVVDNPAGKPGQLHESGGNIPAAALNPFHLTGSAPLGLAVAATTFSALDTTRLDSFQAVLLMGDRNPEPFNDQARRGALVRYLERGGKLVVEGSAVGCFYRPSPTGEVDTDFRKKVLHMDAYAGDADGLRVAPTAEGTLMFAQPHSVSPGLRIVTGAPPGGGVITSPADEPGTAALAGWEGLPGTTSITCSSDERGHRRTLFLSFALSALDDSASAEALLENALSYLFAPAGPTDVADGRVLLPAGVRLFQNFPNPFNPATTIRYSLPEEARVSLRVYTMLGQEVALLVDGVSQPGHHEILWDGSSGSAASLPSGVYLYRLSVVSTSTGEQANFTHRMVMLR